MNTLKKQLPFWLLAAAYLLSAPLLFNFYLALSGFIANGFRDSGRMVPLISSYLLPVVAFFLFAWDFYARPFGKIAARVLLLAVGAWSLANLVLVLSHIGYYVKNFSLGAYGGLLGVGFPYDALAVSAAMLVLAVLGTVGSLRKDFAPARALGALRRGGTLPLGGGEYVLLSLFGILTLLFLGCFLSGLGAMRNVLADPRYLFLLAWVFAVPTGNMLLLALKPHLRLPRAKDAALLAVGVGGNLLFGVLLGIMEATAPDFMIRVGKPLFMIAFSVSLPIEMLGMLLVMAVGTVTCAVRLCLLFAKPRSAAMVEEKEKEAALK